ncbi:MAG: ABC transporter ATP-binding protein [Gammaproteobacteria bacterium]|nr:ABC transporter ATP-binding protein [Gammaproteobacteria bacterium]MCK5262395.1 ABC transporter ATP-binding protein [Gammaproteobacteria bacterium]
MNVIECKNLIKSYGSNNVLRDINLSVAQGEFFGLVGMNGSGKSTMMKAMLDLVGIDGGEVELFGISHRQVSSRKNIAYLPDRFSPPPHLKGKDFVRYMLELQGCVCDEVTINQTLDDLELDKAAMQASVSKLSKGMTQKLGLAACLLSDKKLLMLDEPMSGLDPKARVLFKKALNNKKQQGASVFFSSHVLADVDELADRIAVLHNGKLMYIGSTDELKRKYKTDVLEEAYMQCIELG